MYLTIQIEPIPDHEDSKYNIPTNIQTTLQMNEYAYMRDLTEPGMSYDLDTIDKYIYIPKDIEQENHKQNEAQNQEKSQSNNDTEQ